MSAMILCRGKVADNPLYIMQSGIRLYTEEELCYYIYNNIYILTNDFINDELITFLRDEVGNTALAQRLTIMKSNMSCWQVCLSQYLNQLIIILWNRLKR